jgi:hypothetical protein
MWAKKISYLVLIIIFSGISCTYNHLPENSDKLILIQYSAPANQTNEEFITGITWLFSYLGAKLPSDKFEAAVKYTGSQKIEIDIDLLGFTEEAVQQLTKVIRLIKNSEEYQIKGGIDAGRFFAICFNSTHQYYNITGVPRTFSEFSKKYAAFSAKVFACDTSCIANGSRLISYSINELDIFKNYFFSEEGSGFFTKGNFAKSGIIEAFDYMENGQPRFVIYDSNGNLYAPQNRSKHPAGKPAKCMWCHESGMQPTFYPTSDITGYETVENFQLAAQNFNQRLNAFHQQTKSALDFTKKQAHSQGEFIYLSFYEPTAARLSEEWQMTEVAVKERLQSIPTFNNPEFPFLKNVYHRADIEAYAPYKSILPTDEMREASAFEPDYLN